MIVILIVAWIVLCIAVGVGAANRNRFGFGWFLLAVITSPIISGFILLLLGAKTPRSPRSDGLGSVEACSPFRPKEIAKPKQGDWSNVAWTPEQEVEQQVKLKQVHDAEVKRHNATATLVAIVVTLLVVCVIGASMMGTL